ncbi:MAG: ACT domain-containing protein [Solirubrobacterales bacterium]
MPSTELSELLANMRPELLAGSYVYVEVPDHGLGDTELLASVREREGMSAVIRQSDADRLGLAYDFVAGWITLRVDSSLSAVGLTAAVSTCLTGHEISCNVIAGLRHDHLLVPIERSEQAKQVLEELSAASAR